MYTNTLVVLVSGFLTGVLAASFFNIPTIFYGVIFAICPFILIACLKNKYAAYTALFLIFAVFGSMRFISENNNYNGSINEYFKKNPVFKVEVLSVDNIDTLKHTLVVRPVDTKNEKIRISVRGTDKYTVGEIIVVEGVPKRPENFTEDFDWVKYLSKEGIGYVMSYPDIKKTGKINRGLRYMVAFSRNSLREGIERSLPPPHSALYKAMIIGDKNSLGEEDKTSLSKAGLSHIVAISGMHIAVIIMALSSFFICLGMWRNQAVYLSLGILILYILVIGTPASAGRAGIMAGIAILAQSIGRPSSSWRILFLSAGLMVLVNPFLLRYDIGFQLSYLAVLGIIVFSDKTFLLFKKFYDKLFFKTYPGYPTQDNFYALHGYNSGLTGLGSMISVTISAQILTVPLLIYYFGQTSPWGIITNILVVPFLGYALSFGFIASVFGSFGGIISILASSPAWVLSSYIWFIVELFQK